VKKSLGINNYRELIDLQGKPFGIYKKRNGCSWRWIWPVVDFYPAPIKSAVQTLDKLLTHFYMGDYRIRTE
jgi:hypothetical protein